LRVPLGPRVQWSPLIESHEYCLLPRHASQLIACAKYISDAPGQLLPPH
jgi:hypothetical protein